MTRCVMIFALLLIMQCSAAQGIRLDTSFSREALVTQILTGKGVKVGNVRYYGLKHSIGYFSTDTNVLGMQKGLLLSTGNIFDIIGPNISPGTTGISWNQHKDGKILPDKDLARLAGAAPLDQVILEFDFVPFNNYVSFNFIFASEEYPEYVGSEFNDAFGFFLSGNGISNRNLALIPGTDESVTINNINHKKNKLLFVNNNYFHNYGLKKNGEQGSLGYDMKRFFANLFQKKNESTGATFSLKEKARLNQFLVNNLEFDGMTKMMRASSYVQPWKMYHLKIAVGDIADGILDSGVLLEAGSFSSEKDSTVEGFKEYPNLLAQMNWDSLFKKEKKYVYKYPIDERFRITNINFDVDRAVIPDTSCSKLDSLAKYLRQNSVMQLTIIGYTDTTGNAQYNQQLSEKRGASVMDYLLAKGIEPQRLRFKGNSYFDPVGDNSTDHGRLLNRRVELIVTNRIGIH